MEIYLAGLISGTIAFAYGWFHYGVIFGKIYDAGMRQFKHVPKGIFDRPHPHVLLLTFLLNVTGGIAVAALYAASRFTDPGVVAGLLLGLVSWVVAVTMYQSTVMYNRIPREVALVTLGYWLFCFLVYGVTASLLIA